MSRLEHDIVEILITPEAIESRIAEMGKEVAAVYKDSVPLLVGVLKGCTLFMADLVKHIKTPLE